MCGVTEVDSCCGKEVASSIDCILDFDVYGGL